MDVPTQLMPALATVGGAGQQDPQLRVVRVHDHDTVEMILDWLERSGRTTRDVIILGDEYLVRWYE
jgi:hypothetical protein